MQRIRLLHATCIIISTQDKWRAAASSRDNASRRSCSQLTLHSFQSETSWLRFDGQTVNCLNICINPLLLYWGGGPNPPRLPTTTTPPPINMFWQTGHIWDHRLLTCNPHFKSSIGIYAMIYWIGLTGWQCNICAAHDYTHSAIATIGSFIAFPPFLTPDILYTRRSLLLTSLRQNCDQIPCTITRLSLVHTD